MRCASRGVEDCSRHFHCSPPAAIRNRTELCDTSRTNRLSPPLLKMVSDDNEEFFYSRAVHHGLPPPFRVDFGKKFGATLSIKTSINQISHCLSINAQVRCARVCKGVHRILNRKNPFPVRGCPIQEYRAINDIHGRWGTSVTTDEHVILAVRRRQDAL